MTGLCILGIQTRNIHVTTTYVELFHMEESEDVFNWTTGTGQQVFIHVYLTNKDFTRHLLFVSMNDEDMKYFEALRMQRLRNDPKFINAIITADASK